MNQRNLGFSSNRLPPLPTKHNIILVNSTLLDYQDLNWNSIIKLYKVNFHDMMCGCTKQVFGWMYLAIQNHWYTAYSTCVLLNQKPMRNHSSCCYFPTILHNSVNLYSDKHWASPILCYFRWLFGAFACDRKQPHTNSAMQKVYCCLACTVFTQIGNLNIALFSFQLSSPSKTLPLTTKQTNCMQCISVKFDIPIPYTYNGSWETKNIITYSESGVDKHKHTVTKSQFTNNWFCSNSFAF